MENALPAACPGGPRLCVVIPVYNHAATLLAAVRGAARHLPVIVVDDGSRDGASRLLESEPGVVALRLEENRGKGAALSIGLEHAMTLGYSHAITLDADGQHEPDDIPAFIDACRRNPAAYVLGARDMSGAPSDRRLLNVVSRLGVLVATGRWLGDAQAGFRCYPLAAWRALTLRATHYAWESEAIVALAWTGAPLEQVPIRVYHSPEIRRGSRVRPGRDALLVAMVQLRAMAMALLLPRSVRAKVFLRR